MSLAEEVGRVADAFAKRPVQKRAGPGTGVMQAC